MSDSPSQGKDKGRGFRVSKQSHVETLISHVPISKADTVLIGHRAHDDALRALPIPFILLTFSHWLHTHCPSLWLSASISEERSASWRTKRIQNHCTQTRAPRDFFEYGALIKKKKQNTHKKGHRTPAPHLLPLSLHTKWQSPGAENRKSLAALDPRREGRVNE